MLLNSPSNPTGGVLEKEDILAIAEVLRGRPTFLSCRMRSTTAYLRGEGVFDRLTARFQDRTILLDSFSKTYAMTGWRLGYGIMHPDLAQHMEMLMVNSNSCTTSFIQRAAIEALTGPQDAARR